MSAIFRRVTGAKPFAPRALVGLSGVIPPTRASAPAPVSYAEEVLADNPALWWRLDEASGFAQDSSGNGRHATTTAGAVYQQDPVVAELGPSMRLGSATFGVSRYQEAVDEANVIRDLFTDSWTLELWLGIEELQHTKFQWLWAYWVDLASTAGVLAGLTIFSQFGQPQVTLRRRNNVGTNGTIETVFAFIPTGPQTINHIVGVYDAIAGTLIMYVQGEERNTITGVIEPIWGGAGRSMIVGAAQDSNGVTGGASWNRDWQSPMARYSDVALYGHVLSPERVLAHYNAGIGA